MACILSGCNEQDATFSSSIHIYVCGVARVAGIPNDFSRERERDHLHISHTRKKQHKSRISASIAPICASFSFRSHETHSHKVRCIFNENHCKFDYATDIFDLGLLDSLFDLY